jgi:hypothetical protein
MQRFALNLMLLAVLLGCGSNSSSLSNHENEDSPMADDDLAGATFDRILKQHGEGADPLKMPQSHRTAMLVYHSHGILGNGGFQFLFEGDFPGDPEFLLTRQAYKTIGAVAASAAFDKAFAVFPNSTPPADIDHRLKTWQSKYKLKDAIKDKSSPDAMYFATMDGVMEQAQ